MLKIDEHSLPYEWGTWRLFINIFVCPFFLVFFFFFFFFFFGARSTEYEGER